MHFKCVGLLLSLLAWPATARASRTFETCAPVGESTDWVECLIFIQLGIAVILFFYSAGFSFSCGSSKQENKNLASTQRVDADWSQKYDQDGDGVLSQEELLEFEADLQKFDEDGDGVLSSEERAQRDKMDMYDKDNDGVLSQSEQLEFDTLEKEKSSRFHAAISYMSKTVKRLHRGELQNWRTRSPRDEYKELKGAWKARKDGRFVQHIRRESNFVKDNTDPSLVRPPYGKVENPPMVFSRYALFWCLAKQTLIMNTLVYCGSLAFFSGALGTTFWLRMYQSALGTYPEPRVVLIDLFAASTTEFVGDFKFLPTFLLFGLLGQAVAKFKEFLLNMHTVQARIHDIGVEVGGNIKTPNRPETRKLVYKLYRYLNTVHSLTYASVNVRLPQSLSHYQDLGLLTAVEIQMLSPMKNKVRDTLLPWIQATILELKHTGAMDWWCVDEKAVAGLRAFCARHHDLFRRNFPNAWLGFMRLSVDCLLLLETITLPSRLLSYSDTSVCEGGFNIVYLSWQIITMIAVFLLSVMFQVSLDVVELISNPFIDSVDFMATDAVLCSTDQCIFGSLRCLFYDRDLHDGGPTVTGPSVVPLAASVLASNQCGEVCKRGSLEEWLEMNRLRDFQEHLTQIGVTELIDLQFVTPQDLAEAGIPLIKARRLLAASPTVADANAPAHLDAFERTPSPSALPSCGVQPEQAQRALNETPARQEHADQFKDIADPVVSILQSSKLEPVPTAPAEDALTSPSETIETEAFPHHTHPIFGFVEMD